MQVWEFVPGLELPTVLEGKTMEVIQELNITTSNANDGIEKLYEKLDTLF